MKNRPTRSRLRWRAPTIFLVVAALGGLWAAPAPAFVHGLPDATWQTNGRVNAIVQVGNVVYLGGRFTEVHDENGNVLPRERLAAIDLTTGLPTEWNPGADDEVFALAAPPDGSRIFAGGKFRLAGGAAVVNLVALDPLTGSAVDGWRPKASATVRALATWGTRLYVGGTFGAISGTARRGIAAINASTGKLMKKWYPGDVDRSVRALAVTDSRLVVGGTFGAIGDATRPYVATITHAGANVKPWVTPPLDQVLALSVLGDHIYVGARSNEVTKHLATTGEQFWAVNGDGDVQALHAQDGIVYIGGHFEIFTGQEERKLAAVTTDGVRVPWDASANSVHGVFALAGGTHLFVGGDFTLVSGSARRGFAAFAEGATIPVPGDQLPFTDPFDDPPGLGLWTFAKNLAIDPTDGATAPPSALADTVADDAFAHFDLDTPVPDLCLSAQVNLGAHAESLTILRLRQQDGSGLARLFVDSENRIRIRGDLADLTFSTNNTKLLAGWHELELCALSSTTDRVTASMNGEPLGAGSWDAHLGPLGVGRFQIGDDSDKTALVRFDDVFADVPVP